MEYRIGVIGASESVENVRKAGEDYAGELKLLPFPFEKEKEIRNILDENRSRVDGWLFTGPLPYEMGKKYFRKEDHISCCRPAGAMLLVRALEIMRNAGKDKPRFSIDMPEGLIDISEVLSDLNLPLDEVYMKYYSYSELEKYENFQKNGSPRPEETIAAFHQGLYETGKTDGAVTAYRSACLALRERGIPVYFLNLTKTEILLSLRQTVEEIRTTWFKSAQAGTVTIAIHDYENVLDHMNSDAQLQQLEWEIKGKLLPLCEALDGSLVEKGNGRYEIFSSRGQIESHLENLQLAMKEIRMTLNLYGSVAAGIGYGETVTRSRMNARFAVDAPILEEGIRISEDGKEITLPEETQIPPEGEKKDEVGPAARARLKQVGVNEKTLLKIRLAASAFPGGIFSVKDLSTKLSVTPQNIRRIMGALCRAGLAETVSEESAALRGRPGKIYRLL